MENGSFLTELSHLDFVEEQAKAIPTPDQMPKFNVGAFEEIQPSAAVDTLMAQNEDLMSRLKVTLKRLHLIERENHQLQKGADSIRKKEETFHDQLQVWNEKETLWNMKREQLEKFVADFKNKFPDYEKMGSKLERYSRYHDRVKTVVKPYISQLKEYAEQLAAEIRRLNGLQDIRELEVVKLMDELRTVKKTLELESSTALANQRELAGIYERERESLLKDIKSLTELNQALEKKAANTEKALGRQDELENTVIALRRSREELIQKHTNEVASLRDSHAEALQLGVKRDLQIQDLAAENKALADQYRKAQSQLKGLEEQLQGIRHLWTSKSDENERFKMTIRSLERINQDLSQKLNRQRAESEQV